MDFLCWADLLCSWFSYFACWFLTWKSCKKWQHLLINRKFTLRPYCLLSINVHYAFIFFVCNRQFYNFSYALFPNVLLFYLERYHLSIIYIVLLLFNIRILKTMSLKIFGTQNQIAKLESNFFTNVFLIQCKNLKGL